MVFCQVQDNHGAHDAVRNHYLYRPLIHSISSHTTVQCGTHTRTKTPYVVALRTSAIVSCRLKAQYLCGGKASRAALLHGTSDLLWCTSTTPYSMQKPRALSLICLGATTTTTSVGVSAFQTCGVTSCGRAARLQSRRGSSSRVMNSWGRGTQHGMHRRSRHAAAAGGGGDEPGSKSDDNFVSPMNGKGAADRPTVVSGACGATVACRSSWRSGLFQL